MVPPKNRLKILLEKSEWTEEERESLLDFLKNSDETELKKLMHELFLEELEDPAVIDPGISERMLSSIHGKIAVSKKKPKAKLARIWTLKVASAFIIGLLAFSTYLLIKNNLKQDITKTRINKKGYKNDVAPGGNKATLTLSDGSTIVLDDAENGTLTQQGSTKVIKVNGKLSYHAGGSGSNGILYNTIATPRGGQYQVELPDGSKIWLNAASSLRFPTAFVGKERRVEITGEVYFEIAKNKAIPFIISVDDAEIQVTGTHFNVMAYSDESMLQTTLLEGAVKFVKGAKDVVLKPGQQSQLSKNGQLKVIDDVDLDKVVAWKNGFFDFEGSDFATIAKQLSRWYDTEVVYERKIDDLFYAEIPRDTKLSDVLKALELTGKVHFEIEERKIIVLP